MHVNTRVSEGEAGASGLRDRGRSNACWGTRAPGRPRPEQRACGCAMVSVKGMPQEPTAELGPRPASPAQNGQHPWANVSGHSDATLASLTWAPCCTDQPSPASRRAHSCCDLEESCCMDKPAASLPGRAGATRLQSPLCKGHTSTTLLRAAYWPQPVLPTSHSGSDPLGTCGCCSWDARALSRVTHGSSSTRRQSLHFCTRLLGGDILMNVTSACPIAGEPRPARPGATRIPKWDRTLLRASRQGPTGGQWAQGWTLAVPSELGPALPNTFLEQ